MQTAYWFVGDDKAARALRSHYSCLARLGSAVYDYRSPLKTHVDLLPPGLITNIRTGSLTRHPRDGKLFSVDIEVGDKSGEQEQQRVTEFFWLCAQCARKMKNRQSLEKSSRCDSRSISLQQTAALFPE